jgi:hypothetical protein
MYIQGLQLCLWSHAHGISPNEYNCAIETKLKMTCNWKIVNNNGWQGT